MLLSLLAFNWTACNQDSSTSITSTTKSNTEASIAKLIQRSDKIQLGKEWDFVQNFYLEQKSALQKDPQDNNAKLNLAQLFIKEARVTGEHGHYYPAALKITDEVIASNPTDRDLLFRTLTTKAGIELSQHTFAEAKITGEKALSINPNNAQVYGVLVDANVELGDYKKAVEMADKMISIKPDIRSYSRVSYLREIHGDIKGAISAMEMAVKAGYPGNEETAWAMLTLGELYSQYGETEKAAKIFKAILEIRPDYPFAIAALGDIYYQQEDWDNANKQIQEAMDIIPEVGFYVQKAYLLKALGDAEAFYDIKKEIFEMLEDDVVHGHNMNMEYADIYLELLEDPSMALKYASKEYELRPNNIDVNRLMAKIHKSNNDVETAKMFTEAAAVTNSVHPELIALQSTL